jgi:hypothetical protein
MFTNEFEITWGMALQEKSLGLILQICSAHSTQFIYPILSFLLRPTELV